MNNNEDEQNKMIRMNIILNALEDGWTVKKSVMGNKTFEFTKNIQEIDQKGLIIFTTNTFFCDDFTNNLKRFKLTKLKKTISNPI